MANLTVKNRFYYDDSNIGAVICRTPKTLNNEEVDGTLIDNRCALVRTVDQMLEYFGDPFINPSEYYDLLVAYDLIRRNIPVYISSVYEMKDNSDGFDISYNGYTEFMFRDRNGYDTVGYKLKSDIKFCQPIIQTSFSSNRLTVKVLLYLMNRALIQDKYELSTFDTSQLYNILSFTFDANKIKDQNIIDTLKLNGLELQVVNSSTETSLLDEFTRFKELKISFETDKSLFPSDADLYNDGKIIREEYWYHVHSNDYSYNFSDGATILREYTSAIEALSLKSPEPHMLCLSKIFQSSEKRDEEDNITMAVMNEAEPDTYSAIQNLLLYYFTEDSNTYLFISTPDVHFSTVVDILSGANKYNESYILPEQYNCDVHFGFAGDFINSSLYYNNPTRVFYPASLLSFYNLMLNSTAYMTNSVKGLNISNGCMKLTISEPMAKKLADLRCNSVVLFDIGAPSIYGDRSLSLLPNLRYSHISRNFIRIRRLIREYLATKLFMLNTVFNVRSCINYITTDILDIYKQAGVLSNYSINYSTELKTVKINVTLTFSAVAESISLDFVI